MQIRVLLWREVALVSGVLPIGVLAFRAAQRAAHDDSAIVAVMLMATFCSIVGGIAAGQLGRSFAGWALAGFMFMGLPFLLLAVLKVSADAPVNRSAAATSAEGLQGGFRPGQAAPAHVSPAEPEKHNLASDIVANYSLRYLLDRGSFPSREQVEEWIGRLESLEKNELIRLGGDPDALKSFLRPRV